LCARRSCGIIALVTASVYSRALLRAAELLGGRDRLATALRVSRDELDSWIGSAAKPPREVFLRAVDIILDETSVAADPNDTPDTPPHDAAGSSQRYID
jgi:hypothetical protein